MYRCSLAQFRGCVTSGRSMAVLAVRASTLNISLKSPEHNLQQLLPRDFADLRKCDMLIIIL